MYKIEKDIKISPRGHQKYPFATMEIGDSFFAPRDEKRSLAFLANSIKGACRGTRFSEKDFVTRTIKDEPNPGVRCWRIK